MSGYVNITIRNQRQYNISIGFGEFNLNIVNYFKIPAR